MKRIELDGETVSEIQALLARFRNYKAFSSNKKAAFKFVSLVGIRICPYCNINYTYTVITRSKKLILRCDIDHFRPQSISRKKALKHDNLVPSCQQCNSRLKLAKNFSERTHINPYKVSFDEIKSFALLPKTVSYLKSDDFKITFRTRPGASRADERRANRNIRDFRLLERYSMHKPEVLDLLRKLKFYHSLRLEEIKRLSRSNVPLEWVLFGEQISDVDGVSLGKMTKDLIEEYSPAVV